MWGAAGEAFTILAVIYGVVMLGCVMVAMFYWTADKVVEHHRRSVVRRFVRDLERR